MARKKKTNYIHPSDQMQMYMDNWRIHYNTYLYLLACQLVEWEGLPDSVDSRYLEQTLHRFGYLAFYKDDKLGYIVVQGAQSGNLNVYGQPVSYHATSANYSKTFPLYHYVDMDTTKKQGVLIRNNDMAMPTIPTIELFSEDLTQLKAVTRININAQKTPYLVVGNDFNKLSLLQVYHQVEDNAPAIFVDEKLDLSQITIHSTPAPYVVDKLNTQRMAVWNEFMTFLGIQNANIEKKERMITDEVNANDSQVVNSSNIYLKARQEACELINKLYGLNVSVKLRSDKIMELIEREVERDGELYNGIEGSA